MSRLRGGAVGACAGLGVGALVTWLLASPQEWAPAQTAALSVHAILPPVFVGGLIGGVAGGVRRSVICCAAALLGVLAWLAADLQPKAPPAPTVGAETIPDPGGLSVLVVAVDGADWRVLQPLIDTGRTPHFAALQERGVSFALRSLPVTSSPVVWTTVATGRPPIEHGIEGFLSPALRFASPLLNVPVAAPLPRLRRTLDFIPGAALEELPVTALDRRVTAVWNHASAAGLTVATVGWWGTWPAEPVRGVQVSDHVAYQRLNASASAREVAYGQVFPPARIEAVRAAVLDPAAFEDPLVTAGTFVEHDPDAELRVALAAMDTYGGLAEELVSERPRIAMAYFQAVDIASHYFWSTSFGPGPEHPEPTAAARARHGDTVPAVYVRQDAWLGRLVEAFGGPSKDRVVFVLSDHGFGAAERVMNRSPNVTGTHRRDGILLAAGGPFDGASDEADATVYDIAPTLLHLLGLPAGEDMPGRVWASAQGSRAPRRIPTWEGEGARRRALPSDAADRDKIELLRGLGYLD